MILSFSKVLRPRLLRYYHRHCPNAPFLPNNTKANNAPFINNNARIPQGSQRRRASSVKFPEATPAENIADKIFDEASAEIRHQRLHQNCKMRRDVVLFRDSELLVEDLISLTHDPKSALEHFSCLIGFHHCPSAYCLILTILMENNLVSPVHRVVESAFAAKMDYTLLVDHFINTGATGVNSHLISKVILDSILWVAIHKLGLEHSLPIFYKMVQNHLCPKPDTCNHIRKALRRRDLTRGIDQFHAIQIISGYNIKKFGKYKQRLGGKLLADIAQATFSDEYPTIMEGLWKRINDTGQNWLHVYEALNALQYLVAHGSERVIDEIREHADQLSTLSDFHYSEKDQEIKVRRKALSLVTLVNDKERITKIRQEVK